MHHHNSLSIFILTYIVTTTVSRPTMNDLISMKKRDGARGKLTIIEGLTAHERAKCEDFADKLLVDPMTVMKLRTDHENKGEFVRAVLRRWISRNDSDDDEESRPCTWEALITCSREANLNGKFVSLLQENLPK